MLIDTKRERNNLNSLQEFRNRNKTDLVIKVSTNENDYDEKQKIQPDLYISSHFI